MNAARRKRLGEALDIMNEVLAEELEVLENLPDNFRCSAQGEQIEDCIMQLEEITGTLEDITSNY